MKKKTLQLPAKKITGIDTTPAISSQYTFENTTYSWSKKLIKSSDERYLPIAPSLMTQAFQNLGTYYDGIRQDYLDFNAYLAPDPLFADQLSLIRAPRMVIILSSDANAYAAIAGLESALTAKGVVVVFPGDHFGANNTQFFQHPFLPGYENEEILNPLTDGSDYEQIYPVVEPSDWVGGEVLYLTESVMNGLAAAVGITYFYLGAWIFDPFTNGNNKGIQLVQDAYSRYGRFAAHWTFPTEWHPSEAAANNLTAIFAEADRIISELSGYGCTLDYVSGHYLNTSTAVRASFRAKIIEFFDL